MINTLKSDFAKRHQVNANNTRIEKLKEDIKLYESMLNSPALPELAKENFKTTIEFYNNSIEALERENINAGLEEKTQFEKRMELSLIILDKVDLRKRADVNRWIKSLILFNNTVHAFLSEDMKNVEGMDFKELKNHYQNLKSLAIDEHALNLR